MISYVCVRRLLGGYWEVVFRTINLPLAVCSNSNSAARLDRDTEHRADVRCNVDNERQHILGQALDASPAQP